MGIRPRHLLGGVALFVVVLVCAVVVAVVGLGVTVHGVSMRPTLRSGDRLLPNPFDRTPGRGDLVVVRPPGQGARVVKRVVGLPGDRIQVVPTYAATDGPAVLIQRGGSGPWLVLREPYVVAWHSTQACCTTTGTTTGRATPVAVPAGSYFVLGDNRDESVDSRAYGFIPAGDVDGVVALRAWPLRWPFASIAGGSPTLEPSR